LELRFSEGQAREAVLHVELKVGALAQFLDETGLSVGISIQVDRNDIGIKSWGLGPAEPQPLARLDVQSMGPPDGGAPFRVVGGRDLAKSPTSPSISAGYGRCRRSAMACEVRSPRASRKFNALVDAPLLKCL
jgi:hypothetical protein